MKKNNKTTHCWNFRIIWRQFFPVHNVIEPHHEKTCLCNMRKIKAQISLRIPAVWSAPLLFASWIVLFLRWNFMSLASLCGWADWFESYPVENPEDSFSDDEAQLYLNFLYFYGILNSHMSPVTRKPVFGVCDEVRHKPACTDTEAKLEAWNFV